MSNKRINAMNSLDTYLEGVVRDYGLRTKQLSLNETFLDEGLQPSTVSSKFKPTEDFPVGISRDKGTGIQFNKKGKTFLGLSNTSEAAKLAKKYGFVAGEIITPEMAAPYPDLVKAIQEARPRIEGGLPSGFTFPKVKLNEDFPTYYNRVKKILPGVESAALYQESQKQYQLRYPSYQAGPKMTDLIESGVIPVDDLKTGTASVEKGFKVPTRENTGVKKIITEALEKNEGYITVKKSIDPYIDNLVKNLPQDSFDKFAVDLIGKTDPNTKKPYTPRVIKSIVASRFKKAIAEYYDTVVVPEIMAEVNQATAGSQSAVYNKTIIKNAFEKIGPKKISAFTAAIMGIAKSGGASDLLIGGTKAVGFGLPFELLFPKEAEAATLFDPIKMEKNLELSAREDIKKKFGEPSIEGGIFDLKEGQTVDDRDIYERAGVESFPSYFFKTMLGRKNP